LLVRYVFNNLQIYYYQLSNIQIVMDTR